MVTGKHVCSIFVYIDTHTHIHTHLTALFPGPPGLAGTRKVEPIWILLKQETVSGSGISWAVCKSAYWSRLITMPAPHHSVFYMPDALPAAQPTASKHWRCLLILFDKCTSSCPQVDDRLFTSAISQRVPAVCSAHKDNLRWQEFCCQWTSRVEQFTCGTAIKWRHEGDFQKTSEDISV